MITFEQAKEIAAGAGHPLRPEQVRETARWWFFGVRQIGSFGVIVDKSDGRLTILGSAGALDDWLWGYDAGALEPGVQLVVTAVHDLPAAVTALMSSASPATVGICDGKRLAFFLRELRNVDPSAMSWHLDARRP